VGFTYLTFAIFPNIRSPLDIIFHKSDWFLIFATLLFLDDKIGNDS